MAKKTDTQPFDTAFKFLAEQDPEALLSLLGILPPQATIKLLPREVSVQALLPDQPYEITLGDEKFIAHIEAQTKYDGNMPERMLDYDTRLWIRYGLPIYSFVLVLTPRGMPAAPPDFVVIEAGGLRLTVKYTIVRIWQIPAAVALAAKREALLPFVPLMDGGEVELEQAIEELATIRDEVRRRELALHFVLLGGLRYDRNLIFDLLGRVQTMITVADLKDSSVFQFFFEEAEEKGLKKGLERGLEKGLEEGLEKGLEEGLEEGLGKGVEAMARVLRKEIANRFPGFEIGRNLNQVHNLDGLTQLCLDLDQLPDEAALQARLDALLSNGNALS